MIPVVLPAQYLFESGRYLVEPQKRLMLAVLQTVVDDYRGSVEEQTACGAGPSERKAAHRAAAYVSSRDRSWPFSFESICETIGLDAERLRQGLIQMARLRRQSVSGLEDRAPEGGRPCEGSCDSLPRFEPDFRSAAGRGSAAREG
jgi:hypothetical protein